MVIISDKSWKKYDYLKLMGLDSIIYGIESLFYMTNYWAYI